MGSTRYDYNADRRVAHVTRRGYPIDELLRSKEPVHKALFLWLKSVDASDPNVAAEITSINRQAWDESHNRWPIKQRNDRLKEVRLFGLAAAYAVRPKELDLVKLWKDCAAAYGGMMPLLAAWTGVFYGVRSK